MHIKQRNNNTPLNVPDFLETNELHKRDYIEIEIMERK